MNAVRELYQNNLEIDDEYECAKNRVKQYYELLRQSLVRDDLKILNKLMKNYCKMSGKENMYFFVNDFKQGVSMDFNSLQ